MSLSPQPPLPQAREGESFGERREMTRKDRRGSGVIGKRAVELRHRQTGAEGLLWEQIRSGKINGLKFRRQHPIGQFITDFCCPRLRLIIELDGAIHKYQKAKDLARTEKLEAKGYRVIRFTNDQITNDLYAVLQSLVSLTDNLPSTNPGNAVADKSHEEHTGAINDKR